MFVLTVYSEHYNVICNVVAAADELYMTSRHLLSFHCSPNLRDSVALQSPQHEATALVSELFMLRRMREHPRNLSGMNCEGVAMRLIDVDEERMNIYIYTAYIIYTPASTNTLEPVYHIYSTRHAEASNHESHPTSRLRTCFAARTNHSPLSVNTSIKQLYYARKTFS